EREKRINELATDTAAAVNGIAVVFQRCAIPTGGRGEMRGATLRLRRGRAIITPVRWYRAKSRRLAAAPVVRRHGSRLSVRSRVRNPALTDSNAMTLQINRAEVCRGRRVRG